MNKRKIDGLLLIAFGLLPITLLIVFGSYKFVFKKMVASSHGSTKTEDIYPEGAVSISRIIEDTTGVDLPTQIIAAGIFAVIIIIYGAVNFLPRKQNKSEQ